MDNKYNIKDFLKLYNVLSDKDILEEVHKELLSEERTQEKKRNLNERLRVLEKERLKASPMNKDEIDKMIKRFKLMAESCVVDNSTVEEKREYLDKTICKLTVLLEEVICTLIKLEEMK